MCEKIETIAKNEQRKKQIVFSDQWPPRKPFERMKTSDKHVQLVIFFFSLSSLSFHEN